MVYARVATGYRVGGPNLLSVGVPASYKPDTTTNCELGLKMSAFNRALSVDVAAYYIDWSKIQLGLFNTTNLASYTANGGQAKSQGIEVSAQAKPVRGMTISAQLSANDAELTQDLPANSSAYALSGDRLPYSARFTGSLAVDQDVARIGDVTAFLGASAAYVSEREGEFQYGPTGLRLRFPPYATANVRAGARTNALDVNLYVRNITNRRGVIGEFIAASVGSAGYNAALIQPRTVGISVSYNVR